MSGFDESIVREYFELNGFFVRQLKKYQVQSRHKKIDEQIDFLIYNPKASTSEKFENFQLFSQDLVKIRQAVVVVKAWHSSRFSPAMLKSSSKIFDFLKKEVISKASSYFSLEGIDRKQQKGSFRKILVIPGLPYTEPHREESVLLLKKMGIDNIISFSSILENLINGVEVNHSYQKSNLLQMLRILKIYDSLKGPQMTFFN